MFLCRRNLYTKEEDQAIKQYVDQFLQVSSDTCSLAGNKLWQEMEEKKVYYVTIVCYALCQYPNTLSNHRHRI